MAVMSCGQCEAIEVGTRGGLETTRGNMAYQSIYYQLFTDFALGN